MSAHSDLRLKELRGGFEYTRCQGGAGAIPSAFDAYLTAREIKTLGGRMDRHCDHPADVQHALSCVDSA